MCTEVFSVCLLFYFFCGYFFSMSVYVFLRLNYLSFPASLQARRAIENLKQRYTFLVRNWQKAARRTHWQNKSLTDGWQLNGETVWLTDGQSDGGTFWLTDGRSDGGTLSLTDGQAVRRRDSLTDERTEGWTDWPTDLLTGWLTDWRMDRLTDCVSGWLTVWLADRLTS